MAAEPPTLCSLYCGLCGVVRRVKDSSVIGMAGRILISRGYADLALAIAATEPVAASDANTDANTASSSANPHNLPLAETQTQTQDHGDDYLDGPVLQHQELFDFDATTVPDVTTTTTPRPFKKFKVTSQSEPIDLE